MPKTIALQESLFHTDEQILAALERLRGSVKIKNRLTKRERDKLALSLTPQEGERLFNKFGL